MPPRNRKPDKAFKESDVASPTKVYMTRVRLKTRNAGRKRKNLLDSRGTTPTWEAFFGEDGADAAASSTANKAQAHKSASA